MLVFLALGDAEVLSFALGDAKVPNARYFAFWWNIGFNLFFFFFFFFFGGGGGGSHSEIAVRFAPYKTRTHGFYLCQ